MSKLRPAVFLDRDGTLNVERSFVRRPEDFELLPGVGDGLRLLKSAGFACVVVSNQSAVGRGLMSEADLQSVHQEMQRQLAALGVTLDGVYTCTVAPTTADSLALEHPERKPAPGLLLRAAAELNLDLPQSWMIGDSLRDMLAGQNAGCRGCILVRTGHPIEAALADRFHIADDLLAAARFLLDVSGPPGS
jgi:D-glycero-D-manno-heptose 1,7-bisphosphate phosphatase